MLETKLKNTYKKLIHYFSIFAIILGTTFGSINSAMADGIVLSNTGGNGATANTYIGTDIDSAADTLSNTAAASVIFDTAADAIAFNTLTTAADLALTITIDDSDDNAGEITDIQGDVTVTTGSTLSIVVTDGLLDIGADINNVGTGTSSITIAAGQEVTTTGTSKTIDANITGADATTTLDVDGTATFSGTIDVGILTIDGVSTFTGTVSASGASTIDAATTFANDVTFSSTTATEIGSAGTATVVTFTGTTLTASATAGLHTEAANTKILIDGTAAQTIASAITHDASNEAIVENSNVAATVTFNEKIGAVGGFLTKLIDTDENTTSVFKKEVAAVLFTVDGTATLTLDDNQATNIDLNTGGKLIIDDTITNGQKVFKTASSVVAASVAGTGNIKLPSNLSNGQTIELFETVNNGAGVAAAVATNTQAAIANTAIRTYTVAANDDRDIIVTAVDRSSTDAASQLGATTNQAAALLQATISAATNATTLDAFTNALNAEGGYSATEDTALAKQVAPQDDMISGSTLASKAVTGTVQGIISNRMASLRSGDAYYGMGMSAGNMTAKSGFIQAFGSEVEQKNKTVGSGTQYGYESSSAGFALGFDGTTDNGATVGLSFSMSNTDLDGKGTGKAKNDIDSYTASLYWDKTGQNGYVEGSLTYGLNENKTSRLVNTAGLSRTYTGSYDSNQVSLSLGGGVPNAVGASGYVTPFIGVTGTHIKTDAYTESSTTAGDSLRLRVAQDDVNSLVGKVGVKYHNVTDKGTPMISLSLNNEFGDDTINSTNTYQGGGSSFTTSTDVEPLSATLGLGYSYGSDTASIEFAYEAEANDDKYLGHYGSIKIVGKF